MVKKSNKKLLIGISIVAILAIIMSVAIIYTTKRVDTSFIYTEDGIVEISVSKQTIFDSVTQQAVIWASDYEINPGEEFTIKDEHEILQGDNAIKNVFITMYIDNEPHAVANFSFEEYPWQPGETLQVTATATIYQTGTVYFVTTYTDVEDNYFTEDGEVTVEIVPVSQVCNLENYCDDPVLYQLIDNGRIDSETCYYVIGSDANCYYDNDTSKKYTTICNENYVVDGTTSSTASGKETCVSGINTIDCTDDVKETCEDNSTITVRYCVDGILGDNTNEECPENMNTTSNVSSNATLVNCYRVKDVTQQAVLSNESICEMYQAEACGLDYTTEQLCIDSVGESDPVTLWIIIGGGLLLVIVIVFAVLKYRKII